ncbi:MAG: GGDEF domain-containing protein [Oricola sp.]
MNLDPLTLMVPGIITTGLAAIMLFGFWWRYRDTTALLWWGASKFVTASTIALVTAGFALEAPALISAGGWLGTLSAPLVWGGVRRFNRLPVSWPLIAAAPLAYVSTLMLPHGLDGRIWSAAIGFAAWVIYLWAAVWTLWRTRAEPLVARWPLMGFFGLHASIYAGATVGVLAGNLALDRPASVNSWFGLVHFETILYAMGTAFFMVLLCRERVEIGYIAAARIDPLTGTSNRGAFFDTGRRLLDRCRREQAPLSLIMFDLDRFKAINDTHGHQMGDRILSDFADTVRQSLRPNDLFGRYGGEEFVVVLPGASIETAAVIAERVRSIFAGGNEFIDGKPVRATVSAGVATAVSNAPLEDVIAAADQAMYIAKRAGRNRVERAALSNPPESNGIIRIA